ncbi:conserved hypothetical protein [Pediculus humanus corporis]|uniref:Trafficking protein particle complex subunit 2-like protein n=1 Tax=Pediculus humanus subsp. corporis TaxID=121224 RepID=E0VII5_PEDHC|nr:uncharacterized protein Phum_PHUM227980 [Pediculus humanus corporis]EEB13191.1 conserved hypothetical protein [Pediculus humanus corporis]
MVVCIAVVGKDNSPQFIWVANPELELQFHYKIHTSLDIIEEKLCNTGSSEVKKLYLGLLHSTEEYKIYGYATNTKIKLIIIVRTSNVALRDSDVHSMFKKLHKSYVDVVSNPFYIPGDPLVSK